MTVEEWLIDAVKEKPIIWNTKDENYKNTKLKNDAYEEIAQKSQMPAEEIKKKWHSIRSAFSRELRMRNLYSTMDSASQKRQWKHFNKLMFLQDECDYDGIVKNDITIGSEDDGSSTLYNLTNSNTNSPIPNGQSNRPQATYSKQTSHIVNNKKRKITKEEMTKNFQQQQPTYTKFNPLSEEEIFGHSIAMSLKKFDDKKKEIVKLKLQEVIVQHLNE